MRSTAFNPRFHRTVGFAARTVKRQNVRCRRRREMTKEQQQPEVDEEFVNYMRRTAAMYRLTRNQVVNTYWQHLAEVIDNGFIAFMLRGAVSWESESGERIGSSDGAVWLKSDLYDPVGKHLAAQPVRLFLQFQMNIHDIWGGLKVNVDPEDEETSKATLEKGIADIALLSDLLSFATGASSTWYPARYLKVKVTPISTPPPDEEERYEWQCWPLPRRSEEHSGVGIRDRFVRVGLMPLFEYLRSLSHPEIAAVLRRALSWHAQGNYLGSGLNRFVNYWESIELLAHFFYKRLPANLRGRPAKPGRPTIREKMKAVLPLLTSRDDFDGKLFGEGPGGVSLYRLRNDIAHGNRCDHELEFTDLVDGQIDEFQQLGKQVLRATFNRVDEVEQLIYDAGGGRGSV